MPVSMHAYNPRGLSSGFLDNSERSRHFLWLLHQLRWTDQWVFAKPTEDGLLPLHFALAHKCTEDPNGLVAARELIKVLVAECPASVQHSVNGKLALHMAIENGWPCHDLLLAMFPEALDRRDKGTDLFPFQSAAQEDASSSMSLDVTFELLRANPAHAQKFIGFDVASVEAQA